MKKSIIYTMVFMAGISIGTHATNNTQQTTLQDNGKFNTSQVKFYDNMITDVNTIEIYETSELTPQTMANRDGKIIVEKIIGEVTSDKLDGKILNCNVDDGGYTNKDGGNYINYERVDGAKKGDTILTYYIYNPFTNAQDDVLTRMDFIIDCNAI